MSSFRWVRKYVGPVKGLVLDFSGTTCDKYVIAPAVVFQEVFKKYGVDITVPESRGPPGTMGQRKDLHIKILLSQPSIAARWRAKFGRDATDSDIQAIYKDFIPMQLACLRKYGTLLPGTAEFVNKVRRDQGIKVGVSTGFNRAMANILVEEAKKQGVIYDATVAGDDVANGARPKPHMLYRNLDLMNIDQIQSVIKVDDSTIGIGEGLNAGCWTVGVARWSTYMDISSLEEEAKLTPEEIERKTEHTRELLRRAGAHYVVDDLRNLPDVILDVNQRLANGELP